MMTGLTFRFTVTATHFPTSTVLHNCTHNQALLASLIRVHLSRLTIVVNDRHCEKLHKCKHRIRKKNGNDALAPHTHIRRYMYTVTPHDTLLKLHTHTHPSRGISLSHSDLDLVILFILLMSGVRDISLSLTQIWT